MPQVERDAFRLPSTNVLDLRLSKRFTLYERFKLELLGESFNLINHQNFTAVNSTAYTIGAVKTGTLVTGNTLTFSTATPGYGQPTNSNNSGFSYAPRQIQLAVRLQF
jgi:hypothetical protein